MSRSALSRLALLILAATSITAAAQQSPQPTTPARDPQAMAVLQATLAAMGGQSAAAIQDTVVKLTGTPNADLGGSPGTVTITTKGNSLFRMDGAGGGKTTTTIFNNGREMRSTDTGWVTAHSANAVNKRIEYLPALMIFYEVARSEVSASFIGLETLEGHSVNHIRIARVASTGNAKADGTFTHNSQLDVFVDAQTNLVAKISYPYVADNDWRQSQPMEIYYDDYRTLNGIAVPYHQRLFYAGMAIGETYISSFAVNQGTPDSTFKGNLP